MLEPFYLIFWSKVAGTDSPQDDQSNYPIFQGYDDINPGTTNGCGSASMNCLTQASHGRKLAAEHGPMIYNALSPTGGAVGVATTAARVAVGIFSFGLSEAVISPVLTSQFSSMKPVLQRINGYNPEPCNRMSFLDNTLEGGDPCLILMDRGPTKFHWICCCGYYDHAGKRYYIINDWGKQLIYPRAVIDDYTSATLDNFVAVKSNGWRKCVFPSLDKPAFGINFKV
ncbi:hypothetical protein EON63_06180 [archaeon]|nr:MAG: hypothetical protein EON63_06180 [archaeon]